MRYPGGKASASDAGPLEGLPFSIPNLGNRIFPDLQQ